MKFSEQDLQPNKKIPFNQVRVGNQSDARWRAVPVKVREIDALAARPSMSRYKLVR